MTVYQHRFPASVDRYVSRIIGELDDSDLVAVEIRTFGATTNDLSPQQIRFELETRLWPRCCTLERLAFEIYGVARIPDHWKLVVEPLLPDRAMDSWDSGRPIFVRNAPSNQEPDGDGSRMLSLVDTMRIRRERRFTLIRADHPADCILGGILQPSPETVEHSAWSSELTGIQGCFEELEIPWHRDAIIDNQGLFWMSVALPLHTLPRVLAKRAANGRLFDDLVYDPEFQWTMVADHEGWYTVFTHSASRNVLQGDARLERV